MLAEEPSDLSDFFLASDERRQLKWKIVWESVEGAQVWELGRQIGREQLVHVFRSREIAETVFAEISQARVRWKIALREMCGHAGEQDLAAVADAEESGDAIDGGSEEVAVALVCGARVNGRAHVKAADCAEVLSRECSLRGKHRSDGIIGTREGRAESVPDRLEHVAAMVDDRGPYDLVVPADRRLHRGAIPFPSFGAALDIREGERDGAGWDRRGRRFLGRRAHEESFARGNALPVG
jgi:hypothetical protein